jgi:integrase
MTTHQDTSRPTIKTPQDTSRLGYIPNAISQNSEITKSQATLEHEMNTEPNETPHNRATQNGIAKSAKSQMVGRISRLVRAAGLTYEDWRYVSRRVRQRCELQPAKKPKKLPRVLNADDFRAFYKVVDQADDVQHALMLRLTFFTAVRVSELCGIEVSHVDLENCKIFIDQGKGSKDRYVLFGKSFATALKTHIQAHPNNRWLFQTARHSKFSPRRVQQIVKKYAEQAGVQATPHTFRHQAITWLTRHSGMADAELQLITGHARRETLAIYQHVALDGELEAKYQQAMKDAGL